MGLDAQSMPMLGDGPTMSREKQANPSQIEMLRDVDSAAGTCPASTYAPPLRVFHGYY